MMKPNRLRSTDSPVALYGMNHAKPAPFSVRFWGVRGSIACSGPRTARYGGNTSSLEVRCGDRLLLFDAGTGMRYLGNEMDSSGPVEAIEADVFLTHTHYDHVCGIPFFRPFFRP